MERDPSEWIAGYLDWLEAGNVGSPDEYVKWYELDRARATLDRLRLWLEVNDLSERDSNVTKDILFAQLRTIREIVEEG